MTRKLHSSLEVDARDHLWVFMDGPGLEELGWSDQTRLLADFECEHGFLPTDSRPGCGCWPVKEELA